MSRFLAILVSLAFFLATTGTKAAVPKGWERFISAGALAGTGKVAVLHLPDEPWESAAVPPATAAHEENETTSDTSPREKASDNLTDAEATPCACGHAVTLPPPPWRPAFHGRAQERGPGIALVRRHLRPPSFAPSHAFA